MSISKNVLLKTGLIASLLLASISSVYLINFTLNRTDRYSLSTKEILQKAKSISVKIRAGRSSGSGIIIDRQGRVYTIVTNRHVIKRGTSYKVQTLDRYVYQAKLIISGKQDDLAILQFHSDRNYDRAAIATDIKTGERLFAAGFPFSSNKLQLTSGKLVMKLDRPLQDGYQIGYTNEIENGMSGGAILNSTGKVIGVNGRSAEPAIPDYLFRDSSYPDRQLQKQMSVLSWGIPLGRVLEMKKIIFIYQN